METPLSNECDAGFRSSIRRGQFFRLSMGKTVLRLGKLGKAEYPWIGLLDRRDRGVKRAAIVPPAMTRTPWGDATKLRQRRLPPGPANSAAAVEQNQRERLFAALVATVAEKGYEATRVEDLVELSGVSRSAFYKHFADKGECFLAAVEALVEPTLKQISERSGADEGPALARASLGSFLALLVEQSAAARMCFVDVYAAGPRATEVVAAGIASFEEEMLRGLKHLPGREGMPRPIVRAVLGGMQKLISTRLYRGEEAQLPELEEAMWEWCLSYLPPPGPLRAPRRRSLHTPSFAERQAASTPAERILRAVAVVVADKGYPEMRLSEVVDCAGVSRRTFYQQFQSKDEALGAAIDQGSSQMLAAVYPAFRRAGDWAHGVRAALEAMFSFAAVEPEYTRLGADAIYTAGRPALAQRDRVMAGMEALLAPGAEVNEVGAPAIAAEASGGAVYALVRDQVRRKGPANLPEILPLATYVALVPFIGPERAYEVACE